MTGERQVPFYCPYCGEESLRPDGPQVGEWECGTCARGFELRFRSAARPAGAAPSAGTGRGHDRPGD